MPMSPMNQPTAGPSIMASISPNLSNPGSAMQGPAGLMGQNVQVAPGRAPRPVSIPEQVMMQAMMRRMQA